MQFTAPSIELQSGYFSLILLKHGIECLPHTLAQWIIKNQWLNLRHTLMNLNMWLGGGEGKLLVLPQPPTHPLHDPQLTPLLSWIHENLTFAQLISIASLFATFFSNDKQEFLSLSASNSLDFINLILNSNPHLPSAPPLYTPPNLHRSVVNVSSTTLQILYRPYVFEILTNHQIIVRNLLTAPSLDLDPTDPFTLPRLYRLTTSRKTTRSKLSRLETLPYFQLSGTAEHEFILLEQCRWRPVL